MNYLMKKSMLGLLIVVILLGVVTPTFAYNYWANKAKLTGGIKGETYYISSDYFDGRYYGGFIRNAVSQWNSKVNATASDSTDVAFTQSTSPTGTTVDFFIGNYGSTGWNGVADFFKNGEGQINQDGYGPTRNYDWSNLYLNDSYLNDDSSTDITATAKHEFGHALGLAHSGTKDAIMYKDRTRNTYDVMYDDVTGVRKLY